MLGSRSALRAVHRGVRGVDQVHDPAVLAAHLDQGLFGGADSGVGGLLGHGGLGEEFRSEVLDGQGVMVADDELGPLAGRVLALPSDLWCAVARRCFAVR